MKKLITTLALLLIAFAATAQYTGGVGDGNASAASEKFYPVMDYKFIKIDGQFLKIDGKLIIKRVSTGRYAYENKQEKLKNEFLEYLAELGYVIIVTEKELEELKDQRILALR